MEPHDDVPATPYAHLPEDELLVRARDHADHAAEVELLTRYLGWIAAVVHRVVDDVNLPPKHWDDAQQEGLCAHHDAIAHYQPAAGAAPDGLFRCFLALVVDARVRDLARRVRRHEQHCGTPLDGSAEPVDPTADPAALAERHEREERLAHELARLGPAERALVETLLCRGSLAGVAAAAERGYDVMKRERHRIVIQLQEALGDVFD
jgi:DNA-directed RNA polymerase specialized sigma24 family protein